MSDGKAIIITGASRGIGRQLAVDGAREGHSVVINYRGDVEAAEAVVREITEAGGQALPVKADVGDPADVNGLITATLDRFGRIDCVINNAGLGDAISLEDLAMVTFEKTLRVNLVSAFLVSQAAVPHMKEHGGRLVFMSSGAARTGGKISAAYAASKAGLEGLMHYYATSLRSCRITANAIAPTLIDTDMTRSMDLPRPSDLPLGRLGRPDELWPAVRMILETEYPTGQTIHIDAGRYMT